ncbi:hypothetical protein N0V90_005589 [Kalmusia sp. IMI 367209]|nr:hypothetical protein N0V90_005589 [Kalmusia sp. IMI 367209]
MWLRRRLSCLALTNDPCVGIRDATRVTANNSKQELESGYTEDASNSNLGAFLESSDFQGRAFVPKKHKIGFPLNNLPNELLDKIIEWLVLMYLAHPRKACWNLHELLNLRHVNTELPGIFADEILRALHLHLTYPNIPLFLPCRFISSSSPAIPHRRAIFASALYNSTLSLQNRHVGSALIKRILACATYALSLSPPTTLTKKDILHRLCTAASQKTTFSRCKTRERLVEQQLWKPSHNYPGTASDAEQRLPTSREADILCVLIILDMEDHAIEMLNNLEFYEQSTLFGTQERVAVHWGRTRVAAWFEKNGKGRGLVKEDE